MAVPGSMLDEVIIWVRRIIKTESDQSVTDDSIREYLNRFYLYHVPERVQLFELTRQYVMPTVPNQNYYTFPPRNADNSIQIDYPKISPPVFVDGIEIGFFQSDYQFYRTYPEQVYNETPETGDGTPGPYSINLSYQPIQKSFIDPQSYSVPSIIISAEDDNGDTLFIVDNGSGSLRSVDSSLQLDSAAVAGTINYVTGVISDLIFNNNIPSTSNIRVQSIPYTAGRPVAVLFYDNYLKTYPVPDKVYRMTFNVKITPAEFLENDSSMVFSYMSEYLARGAARMMLMDSGDESQINFYEPFFREAENEVLRRTSKQNQVTRTPTIFAGQTANGTFYPFKQY